MASGGPYARDFGGGHGHAQARAAHEDGALNELTDAHRLYPTLGVIPARQLSMLKDRGYDGYLSVEVFRPDYWEQPIEEIAGRAFSTLGDLIASL